MKVPSVVTLALSFVCPAFILVLSASPVRAQTGAVIYACIQKNNGQSRIVEAPSECRPSEVAVSWNQVGPQGPQGPKGDTGDQGPAGHSPSLSWSGDQIAIDGAATGPHLTGPTGADGTPGLDGKPGDPGPKGDQGESGPPGHSPVLTWSGDRIAIDGAVTGPHLTGPTGPSGVSGYELISVNYDCPGTAWCRVPANCSAGKRVIGGGFDVSGSWGIAGWSVGGTYPSHDPTGAYVDAWWASVGNSDWYAKTVSVWAICANVN